MEQIFKGIYGIDFDDDAYAYITEIRSSGASVDSTQINAINTFVKTGKSDGWYSSLKRMYLPIWASAAPNAVDMIGLTSGTFNGTVTHSAGYVEGDGSTGYFEIGQTATELGLDFDDAWHGFLSYASATIDPSVPMGARTRSSSVFNFSKSGSFLRTTFANDGLLLATDSDIGIVSSIRTSATRAMFKRISSGRSTIASDSTAATGSLPSADLNYMRFNPTDGAAVYSDAKFGAVFYGTYVLDATDSSFTAALKNLWETSTGLTLP
jgi:hypothetical protein